MPKIGCCIVTYNRSCDLQACVKSLIAQTRPFDRIIIFDNNSQDETEKTVLSLRQHCDKIDYIKNGENIGGAGGFEYLVRNYYKNYDFLYLIDDDVILQKDTLENICSSKVFNNGQFGYLSSLVLNKSCELAAMNFPWLKQNYFLVHFQHFQNQLNFQLFDAIVHNAIPIRAGSFVGMLLNAQVVTDVGFPYGTFFIYGEDYEYALRISKKYPCYLIPESRVLHKTTFVSFENVPISQLWKHQYATRNMFYTYKKHRNLFLYFGDRLLVLCKAIMKHKIHSWPYVKTIFNGIWDGLFFKPV